MKLYALFGQRRPGKIDEFDDPRGPELLLCWDEYRVRSNPEAWDKECHAIKTVSHLEFSAFRVITVEVNEFRVWKLLHETPSVVGRIDD